MDTDIAAALVKSLSWQELWHLLYILLAEVQERWLVMRKRVSDLDLEGGSVKQRRKDDDDDSGDEGHGGHEGHAAHAVKWAMKSESSDF